jgi:Protein of unknown function (DUF3175)
MVERNSQRRVCGHITAMEPAMAERRTTSSRTSSKTGARTTTTRKAESKKATKKKVSSKATARKTASVRKSPVKRKAAAKTASPKRWSQQVTAESDALDLKGGVFTLKDPKKIAASLKRSAEHSARRKTGAYRSALSMLTFYINRAGKTLPKTQHARLERAKDELKKAFGRA